MKNYKKIDGVLLLNKPLGISSNHALQKAKRLMEAQKAGHTGSLDPLATGVLPICLGEATKFSRFLLDADKAYVVRAKLGVATTTGDSEGELVSYMQVPKIYNMQEILDEFLGARTQIPSMYSALKHKGQPLYKLARQNIEVERAPRNIFLEEFKLLEFADDTIICSVTCTKGTYIRTLIEDLGERLGCGAHVTALLRTRAGRFLLEDSYTIDDVEKGAYKILPLECLLEDLPKVTLTSMDTEYICTGRAIALPENVREGIVCLLSDDNKTLGIGEALNDGSLVPKRLIAT